MTVKSAARFWGRRALVIGSLVVIGLTGFWPVALLGGFALLVMYWYSIHNMIYVPCWLCGGSGTRSHRGLLAFLFGRALGHCLRCKGEKANLRWGARMLGNG